MKARLLFFLLITESFLFAQDPTAPIVVNSVHFPVRRIMDHYTLDKGNQILNPLTLNRFFSNEISSFATSIKDQSFERYFLTANTDTKTLSIGRSFDFRELFWSKEARGLQKMSDILTLYTQSGLENGFSTIYEKDKTTDKFDFSNNLSVGIRWVHFFNGTIWFEGNAESSQKINKIREDLVRPSIQTEAASVGTLYDISDSDKLEIEVEQLRSGRPYATCARDFFEKKYSLFYTKAADKEIDIIKKTRAYHVALTGWIGFEALKPISDKTVKSTLDSIKINEDKMREWRLEASGNLLAMHSRGVSLRVKGVFSRFNTNRFLIEKAPVLTIQTSTLTSESTQLISNTDSAFLGVFDELNVSTFRVEVAFLAFNNVVGLSGAYEKYLDFDVKNWKFGIPISLKDKDDKPTVNFELVWREISKQHVIGINAVYSFGKFLK